MPDRKGNYLYLLFILTISLFFVSGVVSSPLPLSAKTSNQSSIAGSPNPNNIAYWKKLVQKDPENFTARFNYGRALFPKYLDQAKSQLLLAYELNTKHSGPCFWLGKVFQQKKEFKKSLQWYRRATKINPRFSLAHQKIRTVQAIITNSKDLVEEKRKLFVKQPNLMNLILLERELNKNRNPRLTTKILSQIKERYTQFGIIHLWLADNYAKQKNIIKESEALREYLHFSKKSSKPDHKLQLRLAQLYHAQGQYKKAISIYNEVEETLYRQSRNRDLLRRISLKRGEALVQQGSIDSALDDYEGLLRKRENIEEILKALLTLKEKTPHYARLDYLILLSFIKERGYERFLHFFSQTDFTKPYLEKLQKDISRESFDDKTEANFKLVQASILFNLDRRAEGDKIVQEILDRVPKGLNNLLILAKIFEIKRDWENSIKTLKGILDHKPNDRKVLFQLYQLYQYTDNKSAAFSAINKVAKIDKTSRYELDQERIKLAFQLEEEAFAIKLLEKWRKKKKNLKEVLRQLAPIYYEQDRVLAAIGAYTEGIQAGIDDKSYQNDLGILLIQTWHFNKAAKVYRQLVTQYPTYATAWYNLAVTEVQRGNYAETEEALLQFHLQGHGRKSFHNIISAFDPTKYPPQRIAFLKGLNHFQLGNYSTAEEHFMDADFQHAKETFYIRLENLFYLHRYSSVQELLDGTPFEKDENWYLWKGKSFRRQKRLIQAKSVFSEAATLFPENSSLLYELALSMYMTKDYPSAVTQFQRLIQQGVTNDDVYYRMGSALQKLGKEEKALQAYTKSVQLNPLHFHAAHNIAIIYVSKKDYKKAETYYQKALTVKSSSSQALFNYGLLLVKLKKKEELLSVTQKLSIYDPGKRERLEKWAKYKKIL